MFTTLVGALSGLVRVAWHLSLLRRGGKPLENRKRLPRAAGRIRLMTEPAASPARPRSNREGGCMARIEITGGGTGDGALDTALIQNAFDVVDADGGGVVFVPDGTT
jgi:hypothetical protein